MNSVTVTYRDGRVAQLENIYIRGSKIRYLRLCTFSPINLSPAAVLFSRIDNDTKIIIRNYTFRFLILPDMLKNAPMFKNIGRGRGGGTGGGSAGRGKSAILRAQAARGRGRGGPGDFRGGGRGGGRGAGGFGGGSRGGRGEGGGGFGGR